MDTGYRTNLVLDINRGVFENHTRYKTERAEQVLAHLPSPNRCHPQEGSHGYIQNSSFPFSRPNVPPSS